MADLERADGALVLVDTTVGQELHERAKAAYKVIHKADHGATVVAGSFVAVAGYTQWRGVSDLYRAGAKRYFDEIAVHPFTNVAQLG